jgi:hypothetical protein
MTEDLRDKRGRVRSVHPSFTAPASPVLYSIDRGRCISCWLNLRVLVLRCLLPAWIPEPRSAADGTLGKSRCQWPHRPSSQAFR